MSFDDGLSSYNMSRQQERVKDTIFFYIGHGLATAIRFAAKILAMFVKEFANSFKTIFHM
ncbi:hypothetical protein IJJ12_02865 [bacterium]|nr:hypothetical protein [bacterium]